MKIRFPNLSALLILLALAPSACQSQPTPARAPNPNAAGASPNLNGKFVFAIGDGSLTLLDADGTNKRLLVAATNDTYADLPVFSPDGKQIAYAASKVNQDGSIQADIRIINVDGTNVRVVAVPKYPQITFSAPAWSPDGAAILFTQSYPVPPASFHDEIDRVSVNGGAIQKVIDDGRDGAVSSDGKKIVYFRFDYNKYASALMLANIDGGGARALVDSSTFFAMAGARLSPDSQSIVFAASGAPKKNLPGVVFNQSIRSANADACRLTILFACLLEIAYAHGLPWDLWLVNTAGTKFERLTDVGADSPIPAWSSDGKYIAFFEATGIYVVDLEKKLIYTVSKGGGYGGFDWR